MGGGSSNDTGTFGVKYWRGFMKRNKHLIVSRRGQKYELDRHNWTTYKNFRNMYKHTYREMVEAGVAEQLPQPIWMDRNGKQVDEKDALGCMVTHKLCHPDRCFVGDEVGGNLSMKGDGHAAGRKLLTATESVPYSRASHVEKRFTMIGLTALDGSPVLCVLIIQGVQKDLAIETGIDISVNPEGNPEEGDTYFFKNTGVGKYFPGPPVCEFRGKTIPALVRWNESATITSEILVEMLATLDLLNVIPRDDKNVKPFLLIDGHNSRLQLPFLEYINTPKDHWVVCLGVPYGTALWQVGDSKEQNGSFNIALTKAKQDLLDFKLKKMTEDQYLKPTDLMPLINKAWNASFARKHKNLQAIADRGWNPLNYNLLTMPEIRATMTKDEKKLELDSSDDIKLPKYILKPNQQSTDSTNSNTYEDETTINSETSNSEQLTLNFSTGVSALCLNDIVRHEQLQEARERIQKEKKDGEDVTSKLRAAKKLTAGICWKNNTNRLGQSVFDIAKEKQLEKKIETANKIKMDEKAYLQLKKQADELLSSGKELKKMSIKDLRTILKSLKEKGDKALPTKKSEMLTLYYEWKDRKPLTFEYDHGLVAESDDDDDDVNIINNVESV